MRSLMWASLVLALSTADMARANEPSGGDGGMEPVKPLAVNAAAPGNVTVNVAGLRGNKGKLLVVLYDKAGWLKPEKAVQKSTLTISGATAQVVFPNVKAGTYAVSVIHDANVNGKLDMRWFPIPGPTEGSGVSNDVRPTMGPPGFADSAFTVPPQGHTLVVNMYY